MILCQRIIQSRKHKCFGHILIDITVFSCWMEEETQNVLDEK